MTEFAEATIHGRFQPPLHENHWRYVETALEMAEHIRILITNPFHDEAFEATASWRNAPENNPFSYEDRIEMFSGFFTAMGVCTERYSFQPFNIKDKASFAELDTKMPNIINVYSDWSAKKARHFENHGLKVARLEQPKLNPRVASGTIIRELIRSTIDRNDLTTKLISAGFMPEAIPGLLKML